MSQLTLRDVDEHLSVALKREAQRRGISVNRLVLQLLREAVGQAPARAPLPYTDLDHLAGTWSAEDEAEFAFHLSAQRVIDEKLWR